MLRLTAVLFALLALTPAQATEAGWALLRDGEQVVLIRNAMTPGASDPADFDIAKCSTQRNLSERGKQQARKMGALFAARAAPAERVLSSRYCRALETASLAFEDQKVEPFEPLDLLSTDSATAAAQTKAVMEAIRNYSGSGNLMMVTHKENIKELTGIDAREGEAVVVRPDGDGLHVLGRIAFN
jgi:phosphohistidine phosphatase SixA